MSEAEIPEVEGVGALADELTAARRRGLDSLDLDTRQYKPVPLPELEALARTYANDTESARAALIRDLLLAALEEWKRRRYQDEARFVRSLFFTADGGSPGHGSSPKTLKAAVMSEWRLDDDSFDERRRALFGQFARFIVAFVGARTKAPDTVAERPKPPPGHQSERRSLPSLIRRWPWLIVVALLAAAIVGGAIVWLGTKQNDGGDAAGQSPTQAMLTFDDLGGGSSIVRVFRGPSGTPEDMTVTGTYRHGDTVRTICKTEGREVTSNPSVGERPRSSRTWVRIEAPPGEVQFARMTYARMTDADLRSLQQCPR